MRHCARRLFLCGLLALSAMPPAFGDGAETAVDCARLSVALESATDNFQNVTGQSSEEILRKYRFLSGASCRFKSNGGQAILDCETDTVEQAKAEGQLRLFVEGVTSCPGANWRVTTATFGSVTELGNEETGVTLLFQLASVPVAEPE